MPGISSSSDFETQFATRDWTGGWRIGGFLAALLTGILLLTACGVAASGAGKDSDTSEQPSGSSAVEISGGKINVVATNSLLADLAGQVGGNLVEVTALVPPGIDVHAFQLKPSNNLAIGRADLLVSNGAGLDDFLNPVLRNSSRPAAKWIIVADGLEPRSLAGKPLAGFRATPDRRIIVLFGMIMSVIRFKNPQLHRQSSLRKRRLGENRGFRPSF